MKNKKQNKKMTLATLANMIKYRFQDVADLGMSGGPIGKAYDAQMNLAEQELVKLLRKYTKIK